MSASILMAAAVVPALILVWFFHASDRFPEPPRILWGTFFWGIFSIIPALMMAAPGGFLAGQIGNPLGRAFVDSFFTAAIPEEIAKLGVLLFYSFRKREFDEPMDGVVYGAVASLGFAALENILYVSTGGIGLAFMRALTSVPMHASFGAVMGYFVGRARFDAVRKSALIAKGLLLAIVLHGLYDFPILSLKHASTLSPGAGLSESLKAILGAGIVAALAITFGLALGILRRQQAFQWAAVPPLPSELASRATRLKVAGLLGAIFGGLLASAGGIFLLAATIALLAGGPKERRDAAGVAVFAGLLPGSVGAYAFSRGIQKLNLRRGLILAVARQQSPISPPTA